jgi:hypothetical protein
MSAKKSTKTELAPAVEQTPKATGKTDMVTMSSSELAELTGGVKDTYSSSDIKVPFTKILQKMSPQLDKNAPEYLEDAEEGMFINMANNSLFDGEEGLTVIPVKYVRNLTLWKPRTEGGGLVHDYGQDTTPLIHATRTKEGKLINEDGNEYLDAALFFCLLLLPNTPPREIVLVASGMSWKAARSWNSALKEITIPTDGTVATNVPCFMTIWKVKSIYDKNDKGSFFRWQDPEFVGYTHAASGGRQLLATAREARRQVDAGLMRSAPLVVDPNTGEIM